MVYRERPSRFDGGQLSVQELVTKNLTDVQPS